MEFRAASNVFQYGNSFCYRRQPQCRISFLGQHLKKDYVVQCKQVGRDDMKSMSHDHFDESYKLKEHTVDCKTPKGELSAAALSSIEQFSRLNGLTGRKMRANFETYAPVAVQNEAQNLVEFCCFRYLARGSYDFIAAVKDAAFRHLTFVTMLGWQQPYVEDECTLSDDNMVGELAFVRFAPAIGAVADRATAHHLFECLVGDTEGLVFSIWDKYMFEFCRVLEEREQSQHEGIRLAPDERMIIYGEKSVQKWDKNIGWPGKLSMTDRALYFQSLGVNNEPIRLDFSGNTVDLKRKKVGPFGFEVFDSAISFFSGSKYEEPVVLEFLDFRRARRRRERWYMCIREMISVYSFISEYGPKDGDPSLQYVYGSKNGKKKVIDSALNGISRLQALQATLEGRLIDNPERLLQFSYLSSSTSTGGDLVLQAMAVEFWGGRMELTTGHPRYIETALPGEYAQDIQANIVGTDGSVYLRRWMKSETWKTSESAAFWKQKIKGLVLGKNHVVGGLTYLERAVELFREQSKEAEFTKSTIDNASIAGIPENIDLLKELCSPGIILAAEFNRMKRWEDPPKTMAFLMCVLAAVYMNWVRFLLPAVFLGGAVSVFTVRGLRAGGKLPEDYGKVTINQSPPSNTIQKIIDLKEALSDLERHLQSINVALLKVRSLFLSSNSKATNLIVFTLLAGSLYLLLVPFRVTFALVLVDQMTMELEIRRPMVRNFFKRLKGWWSTVPATPVTVVPHAKTNGEGTPDKQPVIKADIVAEVLAQWFGEG